MSRKNPWLLTSIACKSGSAARGIQRTLKKPNLSKTATLDELKVAVRSTNRPFKIVWVSRLRGGSGQIQTNLTFGRKALMLANAPGKTLVLVKHKITSGPNEMALETHFLFIFLLQASTGKNLCINCPADPPFRKAFCSFRGSKTSITKPDFKAAL
ncbi:MAG TPA: hypothetical protein PKM27_01770 [Saprospiraceae bacterium]|nr:hypothetical protein [Saprospiraceae bacterium]HNT19450.1 hypothetical protein [Saprospiraceae bacterium]